MTSRHGTGPQKAASVPAVVHGSEPMDWAGRRRIANRCMWVLAILGAGSLVGVAASLYLTAHHPVLLIALSPLGRHLMLVAPRVDPVVFVVVAVTRRLLFYVTCFHLGRALGPAAIVWLEERSRSAGHVVRWLERLFRRASRLVVVILPSPAVSTIAGSAGMGQAVFVPLVALGALVRVLIVLRFAAWLNEPIETVLSFIDEYWLPGTVVLIVAVVLYQTWWQRSTRTREATAEGREPA